MEQHCIDGSSCRGNATKNLNAEGVCPACEAKKAAEIQVAWEKKEAEIQVAWEKEAAESE